MVQDGNSILDQKGSIFLYFKTFISRIYNIISDPNKNDLSLTGLIISITTAKFRGNTHERSFAAILSFYAIKKS